VAHNPVGQALQGATTGFIEGGIPGAAAALVVSTIAAFRRPSRPPLFPPFRMALWARFQEAFRPHFRAIGEASIAHTESLKEFGIASPASLFLAPAQNRRGINIIDEVFFTLSNERAQAMIDGLAGGSLVVEGGELGLAPGELPQLPTEGMMPEHIDAKFSPGMDRELGTQEAAPPSLDPGIKRVIDLSRWLIPEEIIGTGNQFVDATFAGVAEFNILRISAKPGKIIGIYNTNLFVATESATLSKKFILQAGTVITKGVGTTAAVWVRQHGGMRVAVESGVTDNPTRELERNLGPYVVGGGMDYVIGFNAQAAVNYRVNVAVMGYYFDEGMWPIGK